MSNMQIEYDGKAVRSQLQILVTPLRTTFNLAMGKHEASLTGRTRPWRRIRLGDSQTYNSVADRRVSPITRPIIFRNFLVSICYVILIFGITSVSNTLANPVANGNFSISSTSYNCSANGNLICLGEAHVYNGTSNNGISRGRLSLISETFAVAWDSSGLAYYNQPVRFLDPPTNRSASFNTSFAIDVVRVTYPPGDGMAFVISADNQTLGSQDRNLGIFNSDGYTSFKSIVVEFDGFENPEFPEFDISNNHVSFDFSNITTHAAANASNVGVVLLSSKTLYAWVEYSNETQKLEARVSYENARPLNPLLNYTVDLYDKVEEYMWIGFSAGTSGFISNYYLGDWTFESYGIPPQSTSSQSNATSLAPSPSLSPSPSPSPSLAPSQSNLTPPGSLALAPSPSPALSTSRSPAPSSSSSPSPSRSLSSSPSRSPSPSRSASPSPSSSTATRARISRGILVGISVGVPSFLFAIASSLVLVFMWRRSDGRSGCRNCLLGWIVYEKGNTMPQLEGMQAERFSYRQLSLATNGFNETFKLGQGGFGSVYKGVLSPSSIPVAVKKINNDSAQGEKEFMAEVSIISRLRHRNLIRLLGWCKDMGRKKFLLVYELMPNGSLDKALFLPDEDQTCRLSWEQRFNVVNGTAAALDYLHQGWTQQIIHRDIKSSNIMLDQNWNAKLGDFGLARLVDHESTGATTIMAGTFGYIAPEVGATSKFTDKTDVFAFGIVVLELACGRQALSYSAPPDEIVLVDWVWRKLNEGDLMSTVDQRLLSDYDPHWMEVVLTIGLLCAHRNPLARPSMRQVVQVLKGDAPVPSIHGSTRDLQFSPTSEVLSMGALASLRKFGREFRSPFMSSSFSFNSNLNSISSIPEDSSTDEVNIDENKVTRDTAE